MIKAIIHWLRGYIFLLVFTAIIFNVVGWDIPSSQLVTCKRAAPGDVPDCHYLETYQFGLRTKDKPFHGIDKAVKSEDVLYSRGGSSQVHNLDIKDANGKVVVVDAFGDDGEIKEDIARINEFRDNPTASELKIENVRKGLGMITFIVGFPTLLMLVYTVMLMGRLIKKVFKGKVEDA